MSGTYYKRGAWNCICDSCGFKYKSTELRKRWDGLMVCKKDWNPRQPQDFVRGKADPQAPPWSRPEPADVFVSSSFVLDISNLDGQSILG